jgi:hypothetical protein
MDERSAVSAVPASPTGKVRVGFFSFTEVTDPGAHRSYNEWHQLDHLPEQYPIPGIAWGQRWVSTPACRAARLVDGGRLAPIHYVTLYLMTDPVSETLRAFAELGRYLHEVGRFHDQRRSLLSGPFDAVSAHAAARALVSAAAVPFRPATGVYVVVERLSQDADESRLRDPVDSERVLGVAGVAGVWSFAASAPDPSHADDPIAGRWRPGPHRITVCYLDGEPLQVAGALGPLLVDADRGPGGLEVVFAGPFETIMPWQWDWFDRVDR